MPRRSRGSSAATGPCSPGFIGGVRFHSAETGASPIFSSKARRGQRPAESGDVDHQVCRCLIAGGAVLVDDEEGVARQRAGIGGEQQGVMRRELYGATGGGGRAV